ncbi:MAG: DUF502 domain-containing protein [Gemmatimonadaceae bacterium]|jgi:uncharacterized membrane protein|nr:DUF502 domain-containing protein [Gemmatimonadaceae bacterium]
MRRLVGYFLRGLAFVAPVALTVYVSWRVFTAIDTWITLPLPGLGFLVTVVVITLTGFLASNVLTQGAVAAFDGLLEKLPFVRLLYGSARDLAEAVVGDKRRFDSPVMVTLHAASEAKALGFITRRTIDQLGVADHVAVYFPFSYSIAGQLLLVPAKHVVPLQASNAELMTFIVSGGVTDAPPARVTPVLGTAPVA